MAQRIGKYKITKRESVMSLADGGTVNGQLVVSGLTTAGSDPGVAGQLFITSSRDVTGAGGGIAAGSANTGSAYIVLASQG